MTASVDPRVERTREAVLGATLDELGESGYGALTIEGVARRARVGKATIYRHWDGKLELVADAVRMLKQMPRPPDSDDHRERIVGLLRALAEHVCDSRYASVVPALIEASLTDPEVREFHVRTSAERLAFTVGMLDEARAAGHLRPDADTTQLAEALVAPIFFRRLMAELPYPPEAVDRLVAVVLDPHWIG